MNKSKVKKKFKLKINTPVVEKEEEKDTLEDVLVKTDDIKKDDVSLKETVSDKDESESEEPWLLPDEDETSEPTVIGNMKPITDDNVMEDTTELINQDKIQKGDFVLWTNDDGEEDVYEVNEYDEDFDEYLITRKTPEGIITEFVKRNSIKKTDKDNSFIQEDDSSFEKELSDDDSVTELNEDDISFEKELNEDDSVTESNYDSEYSSDYSSDSDEEENVNKLEKDNYTDVLTNYHPELEQLNYKEVLTYSNIQRNQLGEIVDELHTTVPFLTKYEKAKILGLRSKQINNGSEPFINVPNSIINGYTIAEMELKEKKIPFIIKRPMPNGGSEYWKLQDLELID